MRKGSGAKATYKSCFVCCKVRTRNVKNNSQLSGSPCHVKCCKNYDGGVNQLRRCQYTAGACQCFPIWPNFWGAPSLDMFIKYNDMRHVMRIEGLIECGSLPHREAPDDAVPEG